MDKEKRKDFLDNFVKNYPCAVSVTYSDKECQIIETDGSITRFAFYDEGEQMLKEHNWDPILKDAAIAAMSALIENKNSRNYYTNSELIDEAVDYAQKLVDKLKEVGCYKAYL